jgi:hypothetical protein
MSTGQPVEQLQAEMAIPQDPGTQPVPLLRFSRRRLALAFAIAVAADGLSILFTLAPPLQWASDIVTALLLFLVLGRQWILLPGLIMEAIPFLNVVPLWVLVVGAVSLWGTPRPELGLLKSMLLSRGSTSRP